MRKFAATVCVTVLLLLGLVPSVNANEASQDLVTRGRLLLFNGGQMTYSGILAANDTFEAAVNADAGDQEANLFYAVTRLLGFALENGGNSGLETIADLLAAFGMKRNGTEWVEAGLPFDEPPELYDQYNPPATIPSGGSVQQFMVGPFVQVVNDALVNLNRVGPDFQLVIFINETGDDADVHVDYADVQVAKSFLLTLKGALKLISAYNLDIDDLRGVLVLGNAGALEFQRDLLDRYPNLFALRGDGQASLADAKDAFLLAVDDYAQAYAMLNSQIGSRFNHLFFFDADDARDAGEVLKALEEFRASLNENRPADFSTTEEEWGLFNSNGEYIGGCWFETDTDGNLIEGDAWGSLFSPDNWVESRVSAVQKTETSLTVTVITDSACGEIHTTITGSLADDAESLILENGSFTQIQCDGSQTVYQGTGRQQLFETDRVFINFNRLFGTNENIPLDIRATLPEFDNDTNLIPETAPDPTFNGVFPEWNADILADKFGPGSDSDVDDFIIPVAAISVDGSNADWAGIQPLQTDSTQEDDFPIPGTDIENLYMAKDGQFLYLAMALANGSPVQEDGYQYAFGLGIDTINIEAAYYGYSDTPWQLRISGHSPGGGYYSTDYGAEYVASGDGFVEWKVPLADIPGGLAGRYITRYNAYANLYLNEWASDWGSPYISIGSFPPAVITLDGSLTDWPDSALVHSDATGEDIYPVPGTDIEDVYMAADDQHLFVAMSLANGQPIEDDFHTYSYEVRLTGDGANWYDEKKLRVEYSNCHGEPDGSWVCGDQPVWTVLLSDYVYNDDYGYYETRILSSFGAENTSVGSGGIEWRMPLSDLAMTTTGADTLVSSYGSSGQYNESYYSSDWNDSCVRLDTAPISASVTGFPVDFTGNIFMMVSDPVSGEEQIVLVDPLTGGPYPFDGLPIGKSVEVTVWGDTDNNGIFSFGDYVQTSDVIVLENGAAEVDVDFSNPVRIDESTMMTRPDVYRVFGSNSYTVPTGYYGPWDPNAVDWDEDQWEYLGEADATHTFNADQYYKTILIMWHEGSSYKFDAIQDLVAGTAFAVTADGNPTGYTWVTGGLQNSDSAEWVEPDYFKGHPDGRYAMTDDWYGMSLFTMPDDDMGAETPRNFKVTLVPGSQPPAIDLDGWGVVTWNTDYGTNLDLWVKVFDNDGIAEDGSSHTVTLRLPNGDVFPFPLRFDWRDTPTSAYYYGYFHPEDYGYALEGGDYTFTVTDPDGNAGTVTDKLDVALLTPPDLASMTVEVNGTTPTFNWERVLAPNKANTYRVRIYTEDLSRTVWKGYAGDVTSYTVPPGILQPNTTYRYRLDARDSHWTLDVDNASKSPASNSDNIPFTTGAETLSPYISLEDGVQTWNGEVFGPQYSFWIKVHDAQGVPGNIESVTVTFPDSYQETLYYNPDDGGNTETCGVYRGDTFRDPVNGTYTFTVTDRDGHSYSVTEALTGQPVGFPDKGSFVPVHNTVANGTAVQFNWEPVSGAVFYRVEIYDVSFNRLFRFATSENQYSLPPGILKPGTLYRYRIVSRSEFFDQGVDNGSSSPWDRDKWPTFLTTAEMNGVFAPKLDLDGWGAVTWHSPGPEGGSHYWLAFNAVVDDKDGVPANIKRVYVVDPDGGEIDLRLDWQMNATSASYWGKIIYDTSDQIKPGIYTFWVEDFDGHSMSVTDDLVVNILPIPDNLTPADDTEVSGTSPTISWDEVAGASKYRVRIYQGDTTVHRQYLDAPQTTYTVPAGVLNPYTTYNYRIYAYREGGGEDLDNLSTSMVYRRVAPHFTTTFTDSDGDGMADEWEEENNLNPNADYDAGEDYDNDGLTNIEEFENNTHPMTSDTDGDGMDDGWEIQYGFNPLAFDSAGDRDGDGFSDLAESKGGSDPGNPDSTPMLGLNDPSHFFDGFDFDRGTFAPWEDGADVIYSDLGNGAGQLESWVTIQDEGEKELFEVTDWNHSEGTVWAPVPLAGHVYTVVSDQGRGYAMRVLAILDTPVPGALTFEYKALTHRKGDLNQDGEVDMTDAVLVFQIIGGMNPDGIDWKADVNGDGRIGMPEAVYILQVVSEARTFVPLTILQTSDLHHHASGYGPFADYTPLNTADQDMVTGGYARLAAVISQVRAEQATKGVPVMLVDSGDFLMGTNYDLTASDPLAFRFIQTMGYDAVTLGNHEFDWSASGLAMLLGNAVAGGFDTPVLASNMMTSSGDPGDDDLEYFLGAGIISGQQLVELPNGLRVGLLGLMGPDADVKAPVAFPVTFNHDPVFIQAQVDDLRNNRGADIVVALSHGGVDPDGTGDDADLAQHVSGIDVIASGHFHTATQQAFRKGASGSVIFSPGEYGQFISRLDLTVAMPQGTIEDVEFSLIPVNDSVAGSPELQAMVEQYQAAINSNLEQLGIALESEVTRISFPLEMTALTETGLGNLAADANRSVATQVVQSSMDPTPFSLAVVPSGVIRDNLYPGNTGGVTFADIYNVLPLGASPDASQPLPGYPLMSVWVTAPEIRNICEASATLAPQLGSDYFLNFSGIRFDYDPSAAAIFQGVKNVYLCGDSISDPFCTSCSNPVDLGDDQALFRAVVDLYSLQMMGQVTQFGLPIVPKHADGTIINLDDPTDYLRCRIDAEPWNEGLSELKEWMALWKYLEAFPADAGGLPELAYGVGGAALGRMKRVTYQEGSAALLSRAWDDLDGFRFSTGNVEAVPGGGDPDWDGDFVVETNIFFPGNGVGIIDMGPGTIDTFSQVPADGYNYDPGDGADQLPWPEVGHVYAFKLADGTYAMIEITEVATPVNGDGDYPFRTSFNYKYQLDGSPAF